MWKYIIIGSMATLLCCRPNENVELLPASPFGNRKEIKPAISTERMYVWHYKDSVFIVKDFLIEGTADLKFEWIQAGKQPRTKTKADTLYADKKQLIFGDWKKCWNVYKKFRFRHRFKDFPADTMYKGKLAAPDFKTDEPARYFRTRIKTACRTQGVNFAGHYTIAEWGCGMDCQSLAIIDRINGKIFFSAITFDSMPEGHCGVEYRTNSRMIIVNKFMLDEHKGYKRCNYWREPMIFELKENKLMRVE